MYSKQKPKKTHKNQPSFSSTLLDEICRSIDGNGNSPETQREKSRTPRACLVDKWMEKEQNQRMAAKKMENTYNDLLFFSSNSTSSDSSGALSSSDSEFFSSSKKSNRRPKPIRTSLPNSPLYDYHDHSKSEDDTTKSKSRALKIYANLKKLKQPISPGLKLTNLINSFFAKKSKDGSKVFQEQSKSREKTKAVRFDPVDVIVDRDSKPCGKKVIYDGKYGRPPLPPNAFKVEERINRDEDEEEDEDDAFSDSSSDLFELDHLSLFGKSGGFCEELPVYKTTYVDKNRFMG